VRANSVEIDHTWKGVHLGSTGLMDGTELVLCRHERRTEVRALTGEVLSGLSTKAIAATVVLSLEEASPVSTGL
jgi:hypothetical protein